MSGLGWCVVCDGCVPALCPRAGLGSPLRRLEHRLHPVRILPRLHSVPGGTPASPAATAPAGCDGARLLSLVDSRQQGAPGYDGASTRAHPWQDDSEEQVNALVRTPTTARTLLIKHERCSQEAEILPAGPSGLEPLLQGRTLRESQV